MATRARGWRVVLAGLVVAIGAGGALTSCGGDGDGGGEARDRGLSSSGGRDGGSEAAAGGTGDAAGEDCDVVDGSSARPAASVEVTMTEYAVSPTPQEVPAGPVELVTANDGRIWHELIVVRVDGDPGALALDPFGGADETRIPEEDMVGKIREFLAGTTCRATFDLSPGRYALICNLVDDGSNPHYSQGMHTALTVT